MQHQYRSIPVHRSTQTVQLIEPIGEGAQAENWLCSRNGELLVRKRYKKWQALPDSGAPREVVIMQRYLSPHACILRCDSYDIHSDNTLDIYFEYCSGGDLDLYRPGPGHGTREGFVWHVFVQMADALAYLHYGYNRHRREPHALTWRPIVHCDVKPTNIFLRHSFRGENFPPLVLGDFGLATTTPDLYAKRGTVDWTGPETGVTIKSDVWGLGATIHYLCHGFGPIAPIPGRIERKGEKAVDEWLKSPSSKQPVSLPQEYSGELNMCMMACLRADPSARINSRDLVGNVVRGRDTVRARSIGRSSGRRR